MRQSILYTFDYPPQFTGGIARYYFDFARFARARLHVLAPSCAGAEQFDAAQPYRTTRVWVPLSAHGLSRLAAIVIMTVKCFGAAVATKPEKIIAGHWFLAVAIAPLLLVLRMPLPGMVAPSTNCCTV